MTAAHTKPSTSQPTAILPCNRATAETWDAGGELYERISLQISDAIDHCVDRLAPAAGESILDVATGTGLTARRVAARGAKVTGVDLGTELIDAARRFDTTQCIDFQVGDADELPYADGAFDAVVSTFGVMFSGNPELAASELARVTRPGGRLALAVWQDQGGVIEFFKLVHRHKPNPNPNQACPFKWADRGQLEAWLGDDFDLRVEPGESLYRETTAANAWSIFSQGFGPVIKLLDQLDENATKAFRDEFEQLHDRYRTEIGILYRRPYLIVTGQRKG